MNHFDSVAHEWDKNSIHTERSVAIANALVSAIPVALTMKALEYGAGTGILSFMLREQLSEITMMDSSAEMVKVMHEKVARTVAKNLHPLLFDIEQADFHTQTFDLIFNQMVMHHVNNVDAMFHKFYKLLNPGGYLAVADLYAEDGSFHGADANVHKGFDPDLITKTLKSIGFSNVSHSTCFSITRENGIAYPIFLLTAQK